MIPQWILPRLNAINAVVGTGRGVLIRVSYGKKVPVPVVCKGCLDSNWIDNARNLVQRSL
jgi:hypothetical protein